MDKKTLVTTLVGLVLFVGVLALMNRIHHPPQTKEQELERLISFFNSPQYHDGFVHKEHPWGDDLGSIRTRSRAARGLGYMGEDAKDAIPALIHALQDEPSGGVRKSMVDALGSIGKSIGKNTENTKNITFALIQSLQNDPHEDVRSSAASSLSWMEEDAKDVVPALIQVLENDQDAEVRFEVVRFKDAVLALIQVLQHDQDSEGSEYIHANATGALVKIGTAEAIKAAEVLYLL